MRSLYAALLCLISFSAFADGELSVTTLAGSDGGAGYRDGTGSAARFDSPMGVAVDASGNVIVADENAHTVRHITPAGKVTTLAGVAGESGDTDGYGGDARFNGPRAVAVDGSGNVYVVEANLRKIAPDGVVTTLVENIPLSYGVAVGNDGNIYFTDPFGSEIKKVTPAGVMTTFVTTAAFPFALATDPSGNFYFSASGGIYKCTPAGTITQVTSSSGAAGLDADASGNVYFSAHIGFSERIYKSTPGGVISTFAGSPFQGSNDGTSTVGSFLFPRGVVLSADGSKLFVADNGNSKIREVSVPFGVISTLAGKANEWGNTNATGLDARFSNPADVVVAPDGNLYLADEFNNRIRQITPAGVVTTFAGGTYGNVDGTGTAAQFKDPVGIAVGPDGGSWALYVIDWENKNLRKITPAAVVTTVATGLHSPWGIAVAEDGDVYLAENFDHTIKRVDMPSGTVSVFAGASGQTGSTDATGTAARFNSPARIAFDDDGDLWVTDYSNNTIRKILMATGEVTTVAGTAGQQGSTDGTGAAARFFAPHDVQPVGDDVYVVEGNQDIRKIAPGAVVTTVAGKVGRSANQDGTGDFARFTNIAGMGSDGSTLYQCDLYSNNIRTMHVPDLDDVATASDTTPLIATVVQLDTDPDTATSWQWSIYRRPTGSTAELSSTSIRNPTFTPDIPDLYTFLLRADGPGGTRYSTVDVMAAECEPQLESVVASTGTSSVCATGSNGTASVSTSGGGTLAYQWGYRTSSGGAITPIAGETSSTYSIEGADLGGTGVRYLVVTVTPSCGLVTVSNQLAVTVTATPDATISASSGVYANEGPNFASVPDAGIFATYNWGITNGTITSGQGTRMIEYTAGATGSVGLSVTVSANGCAPSGNTSVPIVTRATGGSMLYIVTPCRVTDTRGGAALAHLEQRNFQITGLCGIPAGAKAVVANITALSPVTTGFLAFWPAGTAWGGNSTLNYRANKTRANNAIIPLSAGGALTAMNSGATQDIIIDVTGYFR